MDYDNMTMGDRGFPESVGWKETMKEIALAAVLLVGGFGFICALWAIQG